MSISSAKEAREISQTGLSFRLEKDEKVTLGDIFDRALKKAEAHGEASGYLAALAGPECKVLVEALEKYGNHVDYCIRLFQEAGEPTADGGYRIKFKSKWYQAKPVDEIPKCECGFDEALSQYREAVKK